MTPLLLVAIALGGAGYQMVRRPMLRRLAVRDALRRRNETLLVIAGSLLGTAIITGSFIVGDTLDSSIRVTARTQLGPIDEGISVPDPERAAEIASGIRELEDPRIDGVLSMLRAPAAMSVARGGDVLAEPSAQLVEVDFGDARSFGDDPAATGISGETPGDGEVAVSEDLAETLAVDVGDEVTASLYGKSLSLEVVRVLPRLGVAGFWTGFESVSPNAFVAPGTLADVTGAEVPQGASPPVTSVLVSNRGGVDEGAALSEEVAELIRERVTGTLNALQVETYKQDVLDAAEEQGQMFSELFLGIGSFAVIAGVLLLVNIFVMLAEERKSQLGMLRAVGLRRSDLVRSFYIQGGIYSVPSGILGALLGIGVGYAIVVVAAPIFGGIGDFSLDLRFSMEPASIVTGLCTGILIALVTVFGTSLRISRINIIRAIRDLPDPKQEKTRTSALVAGCLAAAGAGAWFVASLGSEEGWVGLLLGPPLFAFALLPLLRRLVARRPALLGVALASLLWGIFGNALLGGRVFDGGDIFVFVLQGVLLNVSGVILLTQTQENLGNVLHRFAAGSLALRLGLAYPLARRVRTGLTLGMFSLVVFTMVFIAVLARIFGGQVEETARREGGGYDVLVDSAASNPPRPEAIASVEGVEAAAAVDYGTAVFALPDAPADAGGDPTHWTVTGIDEGFVEGGPPALEERPARFATDEEAWRALLDDPDAVIVPEFFFVEGGGPQGGVVEVGDELAVSNPLTGEAAAKEIIALSGNDFAFSGVYMHKTGEFRELLKGAVTASRFFVVAEGSEADARRTATRLQGELVENGVEAETFRTRVEEFGRVNLQFLRLMQGYLALGLLVGIAGLGVVMVRAVRERRRQVGVLRSLGFLPRMVRRAFLLESGFTAIEGILLGTILSLVTASQLVANGDFGQGVEFQIPWTDVTILCVVSLGASLLATTWPARQASRIPPAVALRVED
ncbi:MAG TPA: FtsX-like permease family protein [Actinomycetota bacterium]|nr:FtsX-like permease family protein [Actinomycetota bacterium]